MLWDVATHRVLRSFSRDNGPAGLITEYLENQAQFSPDGKLLAAGLTLTSIGLWDVASGTLFRCFHNVDYAAGFAFAPDGKRLVTGGDHFRYWDIARGVELHRYPQRAPVAGIAFTADGQALVTAAGDTLYLWDASTGRQIPRFKGRHQFRDLIYPRKADTGEEVRSGRPPTEHHRAGSRSGRQDTRLGRRRWIALALGPGYGQGDSRAAATQVRDLFHCLRSRQQDLRRRR